MLGSTQPLTEAWQHQVFVAYEAWKGREYDVWPLVYLAVALSTGYALSLSIYRRECAAPEFSGWSS